MLLIITILLNFISTNSFLLFFKNIHILKICVSKFIGAYGIWNLLFYSKKISSAPYSAFSISNLLFYFYFSPSSDSISS